METSLLLDSIGKVDFVHIGNLNKVSDNFFFLSVIFGIDILITDTIL